jgi:hypothetical protein
MNGFWLKDRSWEKQQLFKLENGCIVTVESNISIQKEFIKRIDDDQGYWVASSGKETLPERFNWIYQWEELVYPNNPSAGTWFVPKFEKIFNE